jgi:hypothetical protein
MKKTDFPWTRWFEIHYLDQDDKGTHRRRFNPDFRAQKVNDYMDDLGKLDIPVYMQKPWPQIPNAITYPLDQVVKMFGDYLTNTISYELALAIMEGFEEIHVYGVDMAVSSKLVLHDEYSKQRPSCEYFLGIAQGRGIKIFIPDTSDLLKARFMYGYDEPRQHKWEAKMADMKKHISGQKINAHNQKMEMQRKEDQALGAELAISEMEKTWGEINAN